MPSPARAADDLARDRPAGKIESVATFDGPMPTGVTVSHKGRIFVNFPRWGDEVDFTVAELKDGKPVAYPDAATNRFDKDRPADDAWCPCRAWSWTRRPALDPRHRQRRVRPDLPGGPKLVGVDLGRTRSSRPSPSRRTWR